MNKLTTSLILGILLLCLMGGNAKAQGHSIELQGQFIKSDPYPLQSGEDAKVYFKIRNTGDMDAENVKLEILDSFPFKLKPDRKRNYSLGTIHPGETYYISTEVLVAEDSPDGNNDFKVRIGVGDFSMIEKMEIPVQSRDIELNLANLKSQPAELRPDSENNKLMVQVVNNGEKTAENVILGLNLPENFEPISSFSSRQSLGNIAPGQVKQASFLFDISAEADEGKVTVPGQLIYSSSDTGTRIKKGAEFDLYLSGIPIYEVKPMDDKFGEDDKTIELEVKNTGSVKSESTRLRALENSDLPFAFSSTNQYVGTLETNSSGSAVFGLKMEEQPNKGTYLVDFEVRGVKDEEVFTDDKTVKLRFEEGENTPYGPVFLAGILVLLAAVGGVIYWKKFR